MKIVTIDIFCEDSEDLKDFMAGLRDNTRDFINRFGLVVVADNDIAVTVKNNG